jgi:hypothetical protein
MQPPRSHAGTYLDAQLSRLGSVRTGLTRLTASTPGSSTGAASLVPPQPAAILPVPPLVQLVRSSSSSSHDGTGTAAAATYISSRRSSTLLRAGSWRRPLEMDDWSSNNSFEGNMPVTARVDGVQAQLNIASSEYGKRSRVTSSMSSAPASFGILGPDAAKQDLPLVTEKTHQHQYQHSNDVAANNTSVIAQSDSQNSSGPDTIASNKGTAMFDSGATCVDAGSLWEEQRRQLQSMASQQLAALLSLNGSVSGSDAAAAAAGAAAGATSARGVGTQQRACGDRSVLSAPGSLPALAAPYNAESQSAACGSAPSNGVTEAVTLPHQREVGSPPACTDGISSVLTPTAGVVCGVGGSCSNGSSASGSSSSSSNSSSGSKSSSNSSSGSKGHCPQGPGGALLHGVLLDCLLRRRRRRLLRVVLRTWLQRASRRGPSLQPHVAVSDAELPLVTAQPTKASPAVVLHCHNKANDTAPNNTGIIAQSDSQSSSNSDGLDRVQGASACHGVEVATASSALAQAAACASDDFEDIVIVSGHMRVQRSPPRMRACMHSSSSGSGSGGGGGGGGGTPTTMTTTTGALAGPAAPAAAATALASAALCMDPDPHISVPVPPMSRWVHATAREDGRCIRGIDDISCGGGDSSSDAERTQRALYEARCIVATMERLCAGGTDGGQRLVTTSRSPRRSPPSPRRQPGAAGGALVVRGKLHRAMEQLGRLETRMLQASALQEPCPCSCFDTCGGACHVRAATRRRVLVSNMQSELAGLQRELSDLRKSVSGAFA